MRFVRDTASNGEGSLLEALEKRFASLSVDPWREPMQHLISDSVLHHGLRARVLHYIHKKLAHIPLRKNIIKYKSPQNINIYIYILSTE